jgi:hypothetical protein
MSIKLKINNPIKLDIPEFSCDNNVLGDHLNSHPLLKLLNCYGFTVLIGRPQQGKTSLAIGLLTQKDPKIYRKTHNKFLIMMPQNSINSLKKNPFKCLPEENFFNEFNEQSLNEVYNILQANSSNNLKTILFIDDMTADLKTTKEIITLLKRIVYNRRHLKTNIIITAQSYNNMPLDIRKCITNLFLYKPSKKEMQIIFEELIESKKTLFHDVMKMTFDSAHNFLFINVPSQRMFKNFDELIMSEEDDENIKKSNKI